ncbi:PLP-dependent aminotransferase family protein [Agromyces sp. G08B096]|uniref:PLP-dependent aminotransferase family protein n=1 Tax=Agromyces sp. G08B096 TaxID=3156399 RepID=A0AAU7W913_9MICO
MDGPLLVVDRDRTTPIGVQLVEGLRRGILSGALRAGDPMPSTRALAAELGVARSSVVQAYDRLAGEGYLESRQGAPTRVAALERPAGSGFAPSADRADEGAPVPDASAPALALIDLSPGIPSTARIDERAWRAAWRRAAAVPVSSWSPPAFGLPELRAAIADHLRLARGVRCSADDVVVTAGTADALALLAVALRAVRGERPRVVVEDPGYPSARRTLARRGVHLRPVAVGPDGLDLAALDRVRGPVDAVMVTPSHQYPLGGRLPVADRLALLDWAGRRDALVIEDDYDSEFRHTGAPLPALASLDEEGRVVLVGSFSKVLTPWVRFGYLVLPPETSDPALRDAVTAIRADEHGPVAGPVQHAMADLLASGALRRHIAATRREYGHRRRLVLDALGGLESPARGIRLTALDGGLHAVLELPDEAATDAVVERLAREGVVVAPLSLYSAAADVPPAAGCERSGSAGNAHAGLVIGYAGVGDTALADALARIRRAVQQQCGDR